MQTSTANRDFSVCAQTGNGTVPSVRRGVNANTHVTDTLFFFRKKKNGRVNQKLVRMLPMGEGGGGGAHGQNSG